MNSKALFSGYSPLPSTWDEFYTENSTVRPQFKRIIQMIEKLGPKEFRQRQKMADSSFLSGGITFTVYADSKGTEKIFPFDLVPRIIDSVEWSKMEKGLVQRVQALNLFLEDIYGPQKILKDKIIPRQLVLGSKAYNPRAKGVKLPGGVHVHIAGVDLIRDGKGLFRVLEDNVRVPSGVSYVLENRAAMKRIYPRIFHESGVDSVDEYPMRLKQTLRSLSLESKPNIVVLTPGGFNSAYFEHSFLARRMGCDLVEGTDLFVDKHKVYMRTTHGPLRVDVIYRRIDDDFLDPKAFRKDSMLGVPGLFEAARRGKVAIANAVGNGIADDKAIYPYVPDMIKYYLNEKPKLLQVETYICNRKADLKYTLDNISSLVVKAVNEAGGYGMLVGPRSTKKEQKDFSSKLKKDPRNYIAQPLIQLSSCPTWTGKAMEPRRVDLRPYILTGSKGSWVLPGGLTRVALKKGSYVVNSSQGGGSKDTWVLKRGGK